MSRTISAALKTHFGQDTTTLATLVKLTRQDSTVMGFTDHDADITYDSITYESANGQAPSAMSSTSTLSVDNLQILALLDSTSIKEADLEAGLYDYADIEVHIINWSDTSQGTLQVAQGKVGEIAWINGQAVAELEVRGLTQQLQQTIGRVYGASCDAELGDSRCGVNLVSFTQTGTVTSVTDRANFTDSGRGEADDYFNYGLLTWTGGNNNGYSMEVKDFGSGAFELFDTMPFEIQVGDTYSVYAGCDKIASTCKTKFSNFDNFRGFPDIPGMDAMMRYPDSK